MALILNGSDGLSDVDGSASTPAIRGTDTNTGIFFPAADTIAFSEGGTEAMRIDSSGTLCIGTTSNLSSAFKTNIENGRLGVSASSDPYALYLRYNTSTLGFYLGSPSADSLAFSNSAGTERMRIDSSGNLLVSRTSASFNTIGTAILAGGGMYIENDGGCGDINRIGSDGVTFAFYRSGGLVGNISVTTTATAYNTSSDYRLKENIAPMTGALAKVAQLKPCTYTWKSTGEASQGFIAHELQAIVPDAVSGEKDAVDEEGKPVYQGIDTSFLVATLTAAIQEQQAIITDLKARLEVLEAK